MAHGEAAVDAAVGDRGRMNTGVRLLVVDDNDVDRERVLRLLGNGYASNAGQASTAGQALRMLAHAAFDCALLDYRLPDVDGMEILGRLVAAGLPVVMLTGQGDERIAVEAMKLGAQDYLVKNNLEAAALRRAVENAVEKHQLRRQVAAQEKELRRRVDELAARRKQLEESYRELAEREAKLQVVLWQLPAIVWTTDSALRLTSISGSSRDVTIVPRERIGDEIGGELAPGPDRERLVDAHRRALAGDSTAFEIAHRGRWFQGHAEPLRDEHAQISGVIAAALDVTDNRQLERQLRHAQKMEALGKLAGGVAHDFNNLLTAILSFSELVREGLDEGDQAHEDIGEVMQAARRGARLVRQLLAFSRQRSIEPRNVDINATVEELLPMLRRLVGEDVAIEFTPDAATWPLFMDPGALEQIVVNLVVNARDALPDGGHIFIATSPGSLDERRAAARGDEIAAGDYTILSVTDDGAGIPGDIVEHIFDPFFTTKQAGAGTGLGLATCYGVARQAGGGVAVYSEVGRGTTFKVYLPRAETGAQDEQLAAGAPVRGGTETLLVVEDEPQIRALAVRILRRYGYSVLGAASAVEAKRIASQRCDIALLVSDVVMPEMGGAELAVEIRRLVPQVRVLFVTGYASAAVRQLGLLDGSAVVLDKPFTAEALARKVRELLDA